MKTLLRILITVAILVAITAYGKWKDAQRMPDCDKVGYTAPCRGTVKTRARGNE